MVWFMLSTEYYYLNKFNSLYPSISYIMTLVFVPALIVCNNCFVVIAYRCSNIVVVQKLYKHVPTCYKPSFSDICEIYSVSQSLIV